MMPAWGALTEQQRQRVQDLVSREQFNLAAANTVAGGTTAANADTLAPDVAANQDVLGAGPAAFSKGGKSADGSTAAEVMRQLLAFTRLKTLGSKVMVVQSATDLPQGIARSVGVTRNTQGFVFGGKAYLIADNIAPGKARSVFLHEVGAHLGLENLLGEHYDALVDIIVGWSEGKGPAQAQALAIKALQRVHSAQVSDEQANTELVAYFIEEAVDAGITPSATGGPVANFLRRVKAAFKAALSRFVNAPQELSPQDMVDMAYGAAQLELAAKDTADTNGAPAANSLAARENAGIRSWANDIDRGTRGVDPVRALPRVPDVLKMLGFYRPVVMNLEHVRHAMTKHADVTPEVFAKLPDLLERPRAVVRYGDNGLRVFVDLRDANGNPFVVALTKTTDGRLKITEVSTLFGKDDSAQYLADAAWNNELLYLPQKEVGRVQELLSTALIAVKEGSQVSTTSLERGSSLGGASGSVLPGRKTIVLSDAALSSFRQNPKGAWETMVSPLEVSPKTGQALKGVQFSKAPPQQITAATEAVGTFLQTLKDGASWLGLRTMFTEDLVNLAKAHLPSASKYKAAMDKIEVVRGQYERRVASVLQDFRKLPSHLQGTDGGTVNKLLHDSTMSRKWAFKPDWLPNAVVDPALAERFNAMPAEAQDVIRAVFRHGYDTLQEMRASALENVKSEFDGAITAAQAAGDEAQVKLLQEQKGKSSTEFERLFEMSGAWPYAPLKRFGNYVVQGVSQAYLDAEKAGNSARMKELESDGDHYFVAFTDTRREARALQAQIASQYADTAHFERLNPHPHPNLKHARSERRITCGRC